MRSFAIMAGWLRHVSIAITQQHHTELGGVFGPLIPGDATVLDVGAHAGQFSKLFAKMAPHGVVHAFEPSAYTRSVLTPALRVNRVRNVIVHPVGLSDAPGALVLNTPIKRRGGMGFGTAHIGNAGPGVARQIVDLTTIDRFVETQNLGRIDFIKADIEGWEVHMLRGGAEALKRFRPPIYMEVDQALLRRAGTEPQQVWATLEPLGYSARFAPRFENVANYVGKGDYLFTAA